MAKKLLETIKKEKVEFIDLRFTDIVSKHHHITLPAKKFEDVLKHGKPFDGSSIVGWKSIEDSDMVMRPDPDMFFIDPFFNSKTMVVICDALNTDGTEYNRDPRNLAKRAQRALKKSGIAETAYFGPELEFYIFDSVRWSTTMGSAFYEIESIESAWGTGDEDSTNYHRPRVKGGYFPVPPVDSLVDLRSEICHVCESLGLEPEVHHHEVGTAGQCEIGTRMGEICTRSDHTEIFKYVVKNLAQRHGKVATFMPKPLAGDNGSGMHIHQSLIKNGKNLFSGNKYGGMSQTALYYIGGILKHSQAINAFTNPGTNSYKRLIPGFEAPTILGYSARNRSVSIRIPHVADPKQRRMEVRYPDPIANSYLSMAALLCAGMDGIRNKIDPGDPLDRNMYDISEKEALALPQVAATLNDAVHALDKDRKFLTQDGVFDDDLIDTYIQMKLIESRDFRASPHPLEFDLYFSA